MDRAIFAVGRSALLALLVLPIYAQIQPLQQNQRSSSASNQDSPPQGPANGLYRVGGDVTAPRAKYSPDPEFSEQARRTGYMGVCILELVVDTDGLPRDVKITHPLGMGLDDKALQTVRQWRFTPAMKNGAPVAVQVNVEVDFHLYTDGDKKPGLFQKANAGDAKAQFEIAQILLSDPYLTNDDSKGFSYLEKAARQGLPKAEFTMGEYLSSQRNDPVTAYVWYVAAQRHHYKNSDEKLKTLVERMSPQQLDEARQRVESNKLF